MSSQIQSSSRTISLTFQVNQLIMYHCLSLADSIKMVLNLARSSLTVGFVPMPSPNGVMSLDVSSSEKERVPFLEQACATLVANEPAASSPLALAVEGGTL